METNDLIIFLKVAELGSFSKAAEQLGYVQPNVTARIKILEDELQAPLFKRTNRGVSLLPEGKVLFEYASQVINLISEAKEKITHTPSLLKIGATPTITTNYLSHYLLNGSDQFSLYTRPAHELLSLLKTSTLDIIFINRDLQENEFELVHTFHEKISWLGAKNIGFSDFRHMTAFVSRDADCPYRKATLHFLQKRKRHWKVVEIDSLELILSMIKNCKGMAILPTKMCSDNIIEYPVKQTSLDDVKINIYKQNNRIFHLDFLDAFYD
ncbi:LysR family transcriptional regulator [Heyndrickxia ginsengihumi]|uniref:LysR family transcriptional regulator n=1 Tax=Heyndrickxia ginsengihumi TaxID=363870 RepID=UPI00203FAA4C|nr:LysR family transcriptional regulator [Heyndrickxia ginsengihumi]MCM3023826.1 LysR family transcriptional regulator [Heyndrickxia ginsengihumi]